MRFIVIRRSGSATVVNVQIFYEHMHYNVNVHVFFLTFSNISWSCSLFGLARSSSDFLLALRAELRRTLIGESSALVAPIADICGLPKLLATNTAKRASARWLFSHGRYCRLFFQCIISGAVIHVISRVLVNDILNGVEVLDKIHINEVLLHYSKLPAIFAQATIKYDMLLWAHLNTLH